MSAGPVIVLGFDFGTRQIGVAVGQSLTGSARALDTVAVRPGGPDWAAIAGLIQDWRPAGLVVGLPLDLDGTEQEMTHAARRFGRQLAGRFGLPVHAMDERLTSREACSILRERGEDPRATDPMAAQLILESWLAAGAA